jgi:hypothetical protein
MASEAQQRQTLENYEYLLLSSSQNQGEVLHCATKGLPLHAMAECQKGQQQITQDDNNRSSVKPRADLNQGKVLVMMV